MFITQALNFKTDWWRYLLGFFIIFIFWQFIGSVPLGIAMFTNLDLGNLESIENINESLSNIGSKNFVLFLFMLGFLFGFIGLYLVVKNIHQQDFKSIITSRDKVDYGRILHSFLIVFIVNTSMIFISYSFSPESFEYNFKLEPFLILLSICIFLLPIQTTFEELLTRGYLLQGFGIALKSKAAALIFPTLIFGLLHIFNPEIDKLGYSFLTAYIMIGVVWGIFTIMDDGNELSIGAHYANNLVIFLFLTADWHAIQSDAVFVSVEEPTTTSMLIPALIYYPILIYYFSKKYKWENWSEKLFGKINVEDES